MRARRSVRAVVAAALVLAASPAVASAGAGEGVGYRLTGEPDSTLAGGFIRLPAAPGSTVSAKFFAANSTNRAVTVNFYGADGETTRATGAVFGSGSPTGTGTWVTPSQTTATLPAKSELLIDIAVRVPAGASVGDHVAAVVMEQVEGSSSASVTQVVRYAVPLLVDIAGGPGPQVALGSARMARISGTDIAAVVMPMTNVGTRVCRPVVTAHVADSRGTPVVTTRQLDEILPGDRILYPLRMAGTMEPGTYVVRADVTGCGAPATTTSSTTLEGQNVAVTPTPQGANAGDDEDATIIPVPLKRKESGAGSGRGRTSASESSGRSPLPAPAPAVTKERAVPAVPRKASRRNWFRRAGDAIAENAPEVLARASVPIGASALVGLLFFFQNALDRRDPKLAAAPRDRDSALRFDPNPLHS